MCRSVDSEALQPGVTTMLICDECYGDWVDHPEEFGGFLDSSHRV